MQVKDTNRVRRSMWVAGLVSLVVHLAIAPNVGIAQGRANLMLAFTCFVALSHGGEPGVRAGFLAGLAYDLTTTGPIGLMALELTLVGFVLGRETRNRLSDDPQGAVRAFMLAALAVETGYAIAMLAVGSGGGIIEVLVAHLLPSVLLDCIFFVPYMFIGARGSRGGAAFSGGAGSSALGGKRLRG